MNGRLVTAYSQACSAGACPLPGWGRGAAAHRPGAGGNRSGREAPSRLRPGLKPWATKPKPAEAAEPGDEGKPGPHDVAADGPVRQLSAVEAGLEDETGPRPRLLLHLCCAPCSTHVVQVLGEQFQVAGHFYNPNIHPEAEYQRRAAEMETYARSIGLRLLVSRYDTQRWREAVRGLEDEPEGGRRCLACYALRLEETASLARKERYTHFTTTLSISPHKKAGAINAIGLEVAAQFGLHFYAADFKKKDGFGASLRLSREAGLYRQDYCGCEFSLREGGTRNRELRAPSSNPL